VLMNFESHEIMFMRNWIEGCILSSVVANYQAFVFGYGILQIYSNCFRSSDELLFFFLISRSSNELLSITVNLSYCRRPAII